MTVRRLGVLMAGDRSYLSYAAFVDALGKASTQAALSLEVIERFAAGRHERLPTLAAEIAAEQPDVIVAIGAVSHYAIRAVTENTTPVVFAIVIDPLAANIIASDIDPSGRVTGVTSYNPEQTADQLRLLQQVVDKMTTIAILGDADVPPLLASQAETAALGMGLRPVVRLLRSREEIPTAIDDFRAEAAGGVLGLEVPRVNTHCVEIAEAATAAGLPTIFGADMARANPLLAYGTSLSGAARRAARIAVRIASGESAGSIPIEHELAMSLTVNLSTAVRLQIEIPPAVARRANLVSR